MQKTQRTEALNGISKIQIHILAQHYISFVHMTLLTQKPGDSLLRENCVTDTYWFFSGIDGSLYKPEHSNQGKTGGSVSSNTGLKSVGNSEPGECKPSFITSFNTSALLARDDKDVAAGANIAS